MKKDAYLNDAHVRDFLAWAAPLVEGKRPLRHSLKPGEWHCETLFEAYRCYKWPFTCHLPEQPEPFYGHSYQDTVFVLDTLCGQLNESKETDEKRFREAAIAVFHWGGGGVRQNERRLSELDLCQLTKSADLLDPEQADLSRLREVSPMNSGFSKLYSLLIDGFPIYDSRVACALASLVRLFCEERGCKEVPEQLRFTIPPTQSNAPRNPSSGNLKFPTIRWDDKQRYAQANVRAAWLLGALSKNPPFSNCADSLRALQSAMFMVGYKVYTEPETP